MEEALSAQKAQLLVKSGPEALKMELGCGHGLIAHRAHCAAAPSKKKSTESWQIWRGTVKLALKRCPESAARNADFESLLAWAAKRPARRCAPEQKEVVDEVELLVCEAGCKALKNTSGVHFHPITSFCPLTSPLSCCMTEITSCWAAATATA